MGDLLPVLPHTGLVVTALSVVYAEGQAYVHNTSRNQWRSGRCSSAVLRYVDNRSASSWLLHAWF
jgi:hypothetical protein